MKTIRLVTTVILSVLFITSAKASGIDATSDSVKVWGNCGMCKARIEKAAQQAGATSATWNPESQMLTVTAKGGEINISNIEQKVAAVGHDTEHFTAPADVYNALHGCCKYERKAAEPQLTSNNCCNGNCKPGSCEMKDTTTKNCCTTVAAVASIDSCCK